MKLNENGATVIMVTHEHELVRQFDRRVIILDKGSVVSDGGPLVSDIVTANINSATQEANEDLTEVVDFNPDEIEAVPFDFDANGGDLQ